MGTGTPSADSGVDDDGDNDDGDGVPSTPTTPTAAALRWVQAFRNVG
jgi:hypothetical protein